jgi:glycosyltransferase involved in cell wall biosynthesis
LVRALREAGHEADLVTVPYKWYPPDELIHQMALWRSLDLSESDGRPVDAVIALKFPAYLVQHEAKVVWLMQQFHAAYELWEHPTLGHLARHEDGPAVRESIWQADRLALGEAKRLFATSRNVRGRLERALGFEATVLYHRSPLADVLVGAADREGFLPPGDYVLYPSRLEQRKRQGLLVEALARTRSDVRLVLVGRGPDESVLRRQIAGAGLEDRAEVRTDVGDEELVRLYRGSLAVCFPPIDEDYGYVTIEGMAAGRPMVATTDSGGPLEFVRHDETGLVAEPDPEALAEAFDRVRMDRELAGRLGAAGHEVVRAIPDWPEILDRLLG